MKNATRKLLVFLIGEILILIAMILGFVWIFQWARLTPEDVQSGRYFWIILTILGLMLLGQFKDKLEQSNYGIH